MLGYFVFISVFAAVKQSYKAITKPKPHFNINLVIDKGWKHVPLGQAEKLYAKATTYAHLPLYKEVLSFEPKAPLSHLLPLSTHVFFQIFQECCVFKLVS